MRLQPTPKAGAPMSRCKLAIAAREVESAVAQPARRPELVHINVGVRLASGVKRTPASETLRHLRCVAPRMNALRHDTCGIAA